MFTLFECATLALLGYLTSADVRHSFVLVDINESRRAKMQKFYDALPRSARETSECVHNSGYRRYLKHSSNLGWLPHRSRSPVVLVITVGPGSVGAHVKGIGRRHAINS